MRGRDSKRIRRRGSALIIVVGTLALIAVFAAFYVTLGQADTRVAETTKFTNEVEGVEDQVAEYIARIVGADRLAVTIDTISADENEVGPDYNAQGNPMPGDPNAADRQRFVREATDYPYTDYSYKSVFTLSGVDPDLAFLPNDYDNVPSLFGGSVSRLSAAIDRFRFNPVGDVSEMLQLKTDTVSLTGDEALRDYRTASDPWLSDGEPKFLGRPETLLAIDQRLFSRSAGRLSGNSGPVASAGDFPEFFYLDNRDWQQISNIAPDGLSINLFNLRGHFTAEPGLGVDGEGWARLSENRTLLTLNNPSQNWVPPTGNLTADANIIRATDTLSVEHVPAYVGAPPATSFLANTPEAFAIRNTPAWWTMNQRFLYFPTDPAFQILGRETTGQLIDANPGLLVPQTWATPDFPDYQYADADGDGFYDSRWFSMSDATLGPLGIKDLLTNNTDMRFFVAAKIIDLSARVNVNSATDGLVPPTSEVAAGATPAEIDLRRVLTMEDPSSRFKPVFENPEASPPELTLQRLSLSHIEPLPWAERQVNPLNINSKLVAADYSSYLTVVAQNTTFLVRKGIETGRSAYDALRRDIQGDQFVIPSNATSRRSSGTAYLFDLSPFEYFNFNSNNQGLLNGSLPDPSQPYSISLGSNQVDKLAAMPRWRRDYWYSVGGANVADPDDPPMTVDGLGGRLFDLEDLSELLTFNGVNDDTRTSRLEKVTQGRYESEDGAQATTSTLRFGPLRANRPTALERTGHDNWQNQFSPFLPGYAGSPANHTPDNQIDFESMALLALDARRRLTTISGAAPLRSRVVEDTNGDGILSDDERRLTSEDARLDLVFDAGDAAKLFALYADALAPYAEADATWNVDPEGEFDSHAQFAYRHMRTLAYGHRGSELALRIAAHLSVNMADLYDEDDVPSAYTVVASPRNEMRENLDENIVSSQHENDPYPWWVDGKKLDLGDEKLAPDKADVSAGTPNDYSRIAYNVYGLEPQPFITEVAVVTVYTDTPMASLVGQDPTVTGFVGADLADDGGEGAGDHPGIDERMWDPRPVPVGQPPNRGQDDREADDVTVRTDISPENPDLVCHVLAIQLTNPFDVPIELSGRDTSPTSVSNNDGGALNSNNPNQIEDAKYYIEFNGHFFPLAEYFERDPDINPYDGTPLPVGNPNRQAFKLYPVTLEPGESRVFYVSAHPSVLDMNKRWIAIDKVYPAAKDADNGVFYQQWPDIDTRHPFEEFIRSQFTVTRQNGRPLYRDTAFDAREPVRVIPFNPVTGELAHAGVSWDGTAAGGTFVDFLRTSLVFRDPGSDAAHDRMRQEVRLWRKMTVDDSGPFSSAVEDNDFDSTDNSLPDQSDSGRNWIQNDLLVDRMRDPVLTQNDLPIAGLPTAATVDHATFDPTKVRDRAGANLYQFNQWNDYVNPTGTILSDWQSAAFQKIKNTTVTADVFPGSNTGQGLTFSRFAGYRRPDHLSRSQAGALEAVLNGADETPRGLLPAWCIEGIETNDNIVTPIETGLDRDTDNDGLLDLPVGSDPPVPSLGALNYIKEFFEDADAFSGALPYGFAGAPPGTDTGVPYDGGDHPPYFAKMFRGFMTETVPSAAINQNDIFYNIPDLAMIPTIRRHPALKSDRGVVEDPLDFATTYAAVGVEGSLLLSDTDTPYVLNSGDAGLQSPSVINDKQSLFVNTSDKFGFDGKDPRTAGIRLGDLLMPLGVGATFAPKLDNTNTPWNWSNPNNFRPGDWTTVAEALSAALGLEPPAFYNKDPGDPGYSLLCELCEKKGTQQSAAAYDPPTGTPPDPTTQLTVSTPKNEVEYVLDRGRLDISEYTPFYNQSLFAEGVSVRFIAGEPGVGDRRVGLSVPPAQRLLSMARAITRGGDPLTTPIVGTININTAPDAVLRTIPGFSTSLQIADDWIDYDKYDGPEGVMSLNGGPGMMEWAPGRVAGMTFGSAFTYPPTRPLPFGIGDPFAFGKPKQSRADIAPALGAFRDRSGAAFAPTTDPNVSGFGGVPPVGSRNPSPNAVFDFNPFHNVIQYAFGITVGTPAMPDVRALYAQNYAVDMSRSAINGEFGSSERPGLSGIGSLLGVSIYKRDPLSLVGGPPIANPRPVMGGGGTNNWGNSVRYQAIQGTSTRYGWDKTPPDPTGEDLAMAAKDQDLNGNADPNGDGTEISLNFNDPNKNDNFSYTLGRGLFLNDNPDKTDRKRVLEDEVANDFLEELAIFDGAANTIDTRSDFFAAWFIIRGYRESDVEGLDAAQPMTPTYQKRFLMVLDRSNVTEAGQMPRILLFREVPL
ncbi:MAG: hypothetical protein H6810_09615 [Phycisphaeraceae bacterium]|nr:MAG: hypothetical protein H6810_09615 [Phycisphaeraceae bacterium]